MNKPAQFTPPVNEVMAHYNLSDDAWDCLSIFTKQKLATMYIKHAAAPAMYEALREAQELIRSLVAEEMIHSSELQRVGNCQANMWEALAQAEARS